MYDERFKSKVKRRKRFARDLGEMRIVANPCMEEMDLLQGGKQREEAEEGVAYAGYTSVCPSTNDDPCQTQGFQEWEIDGQGF